MCTAMNAATQYAISWKGLKNGTYHFDFKVDKTLFQEFESTEIEDGDLNVSVTAERTEKELSLHVAIRGTVTVACDRCLEPYQQPVAFDGDLLIRFSDEEQEYDGEVLWLAPGETEASLAQYIYESIVLALPYQRVHPDGGCDPDMLSRFRIVSEEEFEAIEQEAEARHAQPLDNESLSRLTALRQRLEEEDGESEEKN